MARRKDCEAVFTQLLAVHMRQIYIYILSFVPNTADADDILQETTMLMWRKFDHFKQGSDFGAWARAIARKHVLKLQSRRFDKRIRFDSMIVRQLQQELEQKTQSQDSRSGLVKHCVNELSSADAELIKMKYEHGYTTVKIAQLTGRPLQGLYKVMARIHKTLMNKIDRSLRNPNHDV